MSKEQLESKEFDQFSNLNEFIVSLEQLPHDEQFVAAGAMADGWAGFQGAFTWKNIGLQLGNGIISGVASWGIGRLLDAVFNKQEKLENLLESYANDVVSRLTANVQSIVSTAFFNNEMRKLKASSSSLTTKYQVYERSTVPATKDVFINESLLHAIEASDNAKSMGLPALGIYQTVVGILIMILFEKAKTDKGLIVQIHDEIGRATLHVKSLYLEIMKMAEQSASQPRHTGTRTGHGEPSGERYEFFVEGRRIERIYEWETTRGKSPYEQAQDYRNRKVRELYNAMRADVIDPSQAILDKWNEVTKKLSQNVQN